MLTASGNEAVQRDFPDVLQLVLWITAAIALVTFGLAFLLPRPAPAARR